MSLPENVRGRRLEPDDPHGESTAGQRNDAGSIALPSVPIDGANRETPSAEVAASGVDRMEKARAALARGWALTPLKGKIPILKGWPSLQKPSLETVETWVRNGHNLGLRTGAVSGVDVVDFDTDEHDLGELPHTPTVRTGSGKLHVYLKHRDGMRNGKLAEKVDVRGDGGQVVYPGSIHPDTGESYTWFVTPEEAELAEWPEAWLTRLQRHESKGPETPRNHGDSFRSRQRARTVDEFNLDPDWRRVLEPHFTFVAELPDGEVRWRRAGKDEGHSATTGVAHVRADGTPLFHVFSTNAGPLKPDANYTAFEAYALLHCGGDRARATRELGLGARATAAPEWPFMGLDEMYGLAARFVRLVLLHTDADPAALYFSFLIVFGIAIGRTLHFRIGATRHYLNLFVVLIGATARARKGTALGWVEELFTLAMPEFLRDHARSGVVSGEGLIDAIHDPVKVKQAIREKGTKRIVDYQDVIIDQGVTDKRLLVVESEFARVCAVCAREGNTLSPVLRDAFDGRDLRSLGRKQNNLACTAPHMGVLAHVTIEELRKTVRPEDLHGGLVNRFLIVCTRRTRKLPIPTRPSDSEWSALADEVRNAVRWARERMALDTGGAITSEVEMSLSADAETLWRESYDALTADANGDYGAATARSDALTRRLAALLAATDMTTVTERHHVESALKAWAYCARSTAVLFPDGSPGESEDERQRRRVRKLIGERGPLSERDLRQAARELRAMGDQLELMLRAMVQAGELACETQIDGGRPSERFSLPQPRGTERKAENAGDSGTSDPRQSPERGEDAPSTAPALCVHGSPEEATGEIIDAKSAAPAEAKQDATVRPCIGCGAPLGRREQATACKSCGRLERIDPLHGGSAPQPSADPSGPPAVGGHEDRPTLFHDEGDTPWEH